MRNSRAKAISLFSFFLSCAAGIQAQSLAITPSGYITVGVGGTQQFTATASGFTIAALKWEVASVQGGSAATGTITTGLTGGMYTAPAAIPAQNPQSILAVATGTNGNKYSASVNITIMPPPPVITSVSPNPLPPGTVTVTITGSGFSPGGSTILDGGVAYTTQQPTANTLTTSVYTAPTAKSASFTVNSAGSVSSPYIVPVGVPTPATYTLTVVNGTGSGTYAAGAVVNIGANAAPSGQQFQSWSGATVASASSTSTMLTMPAANTTVTAVYSAASYMLTVVGGTGSGNYAAGTVVNIAATIPAGQQFQSWSGAVVANSSSAATMLTMPAANTTVTAAFASAGPAITAVAPNPLPSGTVTVTVTGAGFTANSLIWDGNVQYPTQLSAPNTLTTSVYTAPGTASSTFTVHDSGNVSNAFAVPVSGPPTYTLTIVGGTIAGGNGSGTYTAGTVVNITANAPPSGEVFQSWTGAAVANSQSAATTITMPAANTTLTVTYNAPASYTLTYSGNGSTSGFGPSDPNSYLAGQGVTVLGNIGYLFNPGYSFAGWNTSADGTGTSYGPGAILTLGSANVTLYAQWNNLDWPVSVWGGARNAITLMADGSVWTWGLNAHGQLGNGTTTDSPIPVQVLGSNGAGNLSGVTAVMGGEQHNLALKADGTVWAWGNNTSNQLGDGNAADSPTPVQVGGLSSIVSLASRGYHSLAVKSDGTVWAWGWDSHGALGNKVADQNYDYTVPVQVQGLSNPLMVSTGFCFSVALMPDHTLVAWGNNGNGELGDGTTTDRYSPVPVVGISDVIWVSAGWTHVVAIKSDGTVWTWGANTWAGSFPGSGMLGDGTTVDHYTPEQVPGLAGAIQAFGGDGHTAVLLHDGTVWTFGANGAGQLGTGSITTQSLVPVQVQGLSNVVMMTARDFHNQAILSDGSMWSWGSGLNGELGNGTNQNSPTPVQMTFGSPSPAPSTYQLTVSGGTGSGSYAAGTVVNIVATVPAGQQFQSWSGAVVANSSSAATMLTMPAANTTVTAQFAASSTAPVISSVSPNPIPAGTVTVTLTGTGFVTGALAYDSYGTNGMIQYAPSSVTPNTVTFTIYQGFAATTTFQVRNPDGSGYSNAYTVPVNSGPPPPQAIAPTTANVNLGATQQFTSVGATAFSATAGSITATGLYTAPATMPASANVTVTAIGPGGNASATVTIINPNPQIIVPSITALTLGATQQFTSAGGSNWTAINGTVDQTGFYTAPSVWPASGTDTVSVTGPNGNATAAITLTPPTPAITSVGTGNQLPLGIFSATVTGAGFTAQSTATLGTSPVTVVYAGGALTISGFYGQSGPVNLTVTNATVASQPFSVQVGVQNAQVSPSAARRFLQQAGFGPTPADAAHVQTIGFQAWLAEQFAMPPVSNYNADVPPVGLSAVFMTNAVVNPDQLRQKVAFALSQIFVTSLNTVFFDSVMVPYQQMLLGDAFTNYLQILTDVTLSPCMGFYLNMANNEKADPAQGTVANENYAREVMQLMSIGTKVLNPDGTWPVDSNNLPIPTYQQSDVTAMARIFTGWTYAPGAAGSTPIFGAYINPDAPMVPFASQHDTTAKTVMSYSAPAGLSITDDLNGVLAYLASHPNTAPFISKQLIQHLVKSNPSPQYVQRVSNAFTQSNGDMPTVITAILLDQEARANDQGGDDQPNDGHLQEPALLIPAVVRAFAGQMTTANYYPSTLASMGQDLFNAPSVFNYYSPGFVVGGTGGLYGPEFQIDNPNAAVLRENFVANLTNSYSNPMLNNGPGTTVDLTPFLPLASNSATLVNAVDLTLTQGVMPQGLKTIIVNAVAADEGGPLHAVETAVYLTLISSYYNVWH